MCAVRESELFRDKKCCVERRRPNIRGSIVKTQRQRQTTPVGESRSILDPREHSGAIGCTGGKGKLFVPDYSVDGGAARGRD